MDSLDTLATRWHAAKRLEDKAREDRIAVEKAILELHPAKEEGTETVTTSSGTKIKLTGKVIYKADVQQLEVLTAEWPEEARPIRVKVEADEAKLKAIRSERPDLWKRIAGAVETKAAKTGVAIEFKE